MSHRIADNNKWPKHHEAVMTLNKVAIELKILILPELREMREPEITPELVEKLEEAIRDIEKCVEPLRMYR